MILFMNENIPDSRSRADDHCPLQSKQCKAPHVTKSLLPSGVWFVGSIQINLIGNPDERETPGSWGHPPVQKMLLSPHKRWKQKQVETKFVPKFSQTATPPHFETETRGWLFGPLLGNFFVSISVSCFCFQPFWGLYQTIVYKWLFS